ncbi:MAG: response regulator [Deltaproteobacteria bacterium]|nr:MAG: response regulator [Deltaproteobacteria bacterium]
MKVTDLNWVGIALAAVVLVLLTLPAPPGQRTDLSGEWRATVDGVERTFELPGDYASQGVPPDAIVRIPIAIETHEARPQMLYLQRAAFAARATWDGKEIGSHAEVADGGERREGGLLVPLPLTADGKTHELAIELRGAHGRGAVEGGLYLGDATEILRLARRHDAQRVGAGLSFALLALAHLAVARRRRSRPALWLGTWASIAAILVISASGWGGVLSLATSFLRIEALTSVSLSALLVMLTTDLGKPLDKPLWQGIAAVTGALLIAGAVLPIDVVVAMRPVWQASGLLACLASLLLAGRNIQQGHPGAVVYGVMSVLPLTLALITDLALPGRSLTLVGLGTFVVGATLAVRLHEAHQARRDEQLLQATPDPVIGVNAEGRLGELNPAARAFLFVDGPIENLLERVPAEEHPAVRAHLARASREPDQAEFHVLRAGEKVAVESLATPVGQKVAVIVLRDITRRRRLDDGLLHAARMETVAVLVGGIAHDFNNMLGTLLAHVGFMREIVENERLDDRLGKMESTIERASLLTRRLLTVSRGTQSELVQVDLSEILRNAAELVQPTLPPGVTLTLDIPGNLNPVLGSASDLEHVVVNLLVNARDALQSDGRIELVARDFRLPSGGRGAFVMIEDDGPGVPDQIREEIFNPFFTTKGPNRGTGLGLAVASQILRDHHGRIWVEDRPGRGSRFCLALRHADAMDEAPAPLPTNRRVLLVEDEPVLLDSYATALTEAGYDVVACNSGGEAWRVLSRERPDVLVTDVVMPGITGLELATLCDELHDNVPVLLVSGFIPEDRLTGVVSGSWARLDKPVRTARLVSTVGRLCRRAERAARGELDITQVSWLFPPLDELSAAGILADDPERTLR